VCPINAGTDRLDKDLMIGQMQGKFQLVILNESGHCIQEDQPEKLATVLRDFWDRNQPLKFIKKFPIPERK
jgi:pimeloyl-ACP methyl ester carboxylesterase